VATTNSEAGRSYVPEYEEVLELRVYPNGQRIILPSELDQAILRGQQAEDQQRLEDWEAEPTPPEIAAQQDALKQADLPPAERERCARAVEAFTQERIRERRRLQAQLKATQRHLARAENPPVDASGTPQQLIYRMREFTRRERVDVDDKHTSVDPDSHKRLIDVEARNQELLQRVLLAEVVDGERVVDPPPPGNLPDAVARTLIARMWARNTMAPELAGYFR
jgi:hypothetical protein